MTTNTQNGISLIELMIGLLLGMLIILVATGTLSLFDSQRRTSLAGNASTDSGVLAAYMLQRDVQNAGIGLMNTSQLACTQINMYAQGAVRADGSPIAPVMVGDGGAQGSDTVTAFFAGSVLGAAPVQITRGLSTPNENLYVNNSSGFSAGDVALLADTDPSQPCTLVQISAMTPAAGNEVMLSRVSSVMYPYNSPNPTIDFATAPLYQAGAVLIKTGSAPTWRSYSVQNARLVGTDLVSGVAVQVGDNVVSLQAQYGVTNGAGTSITRWVSATDEWAAPTAAMITSIRAIRVAIVSRSPRREPLTDGGGNCATTTAAPVLWADADAPQLDLSADPEWQCYRYQVYRSTMPLKNLVWSLSQ
jgi:type IV pilus assembly protein PilW